MRFIVGCCPDNFTSAEGPYHLGCGCAGSRYGCCPNGISEALKPDNGSETELNVNEFAGCGEVPGEICYLPKEPGSCRENFTVRWFFDK